MKICFVALSIYACLSKSKTIETIGGSEVQQIFIGKALRDRDYEVSYITQDHGQRERQTIEGLTCYKSFKPDEGILGIRFFYPRLYKIWKALITANADVYFVRCASFLVGILAVFCKIYGKKFIFCGASATDFMPKSVLVPTLRDKLLYTYGLRRAHAIIVQSDAQKKLLWENFHLRGYLIRNFSPNKVSQLPVSEREYILWVSKIRALKRPMQFIRLAEAFPDEKFVMIGGPKKRDPDLFNKIEKEARKVDNLDFLGFQTLETTERYFDKCKVFVSTSKYEGFPNTFLQAWSRGVTVISYVDPDNIIKNNNLGLVVGSERQLREALASFLANPSRNDGPILKYFKKNHSSRIIDQYRLLLNNIFVTRTEASFSRF